MKDDHRRAKEFGKMIAKVAWVKKVHLIETNIVLFDLAENIDMQDALNSLEQNGIRLVAFGPSTVRAVFHLDITDQHLTYVDEKLNLINL